MMTQSRAESTRDTYNYGQYINQLPPNTIKVIREFERIQKKICRHKISIMFNEICIYIYIYIQKRERERGRPLFGRCVLMFKPFMNLSMNNYFITRSRRDDKYFYFKWIRNNFLYQFLRFRVTGSSPLDQGSQIQVCNRTITFWVGHYWPLV